MSLQRLEEEQGRLASDWGTVKDRASGLHAQVGPRGRSGAPGPQGIPGMRFVVCVRVLCLRACACVYVRGCVCECLGPHEFREWDM